MAAVCRTFSAHSSRWKAWLDETTDIVLLNSPWVKRPFGRAFRITWILLTLVFWVGVLPRFNLQSMILQLREAPGLSLLAILTWYLYAASLWSLVSTSWESLRGSVLFSFGVLLSFQLFGGYATAFALEGSRVWTYAFLVLAHCSVHPIVFMPALAFSAAHTLDVTWDAVFTGFLLDPVFPWVVFYSQCSVIILFAMFCFDFVDRVANYTAMINSDGVSESTRIPTVEGSGRCRPRHSAIQMCCFLIGANNWFFWLAIAWLKHQKQRDPWSDYMWQDHLPICSFLAPCLGVFSFILAVVSPVQSVKADCGLAMFCFLPGAVLMLDCTVAFWTLKRIDTSFDQSLISMGFLQCLVGVHALGRCRVLICFLMVAAVSFTVIEQWAATGIFEDFIENVVSIDLFGIILLWLVLLSHYMEPQRPALNPEMGTSAAAPAPGRVTFVELSAA